jgi:hypothetical protein
MKVHSMLASKFLTGYHLVSQVLGMKGHNLKVALRRYLNALNPLTLLINLYV